MILLLLACAADPASPPGVVDDTGTPTTDSAPPIDASGGAVLVTAPNWGFDLGVSIDAVTFEGVVEAGVTDVTFRVEQDGVVTSQGSATLGEDGTFSAADVPLVQGDNHVIFTSAEGGQDDLVVTYHPDSPFASDLLIDWPVIFVDQATTLTFGVYAEGVDELTVGPTASDDWATLLPSDEDPRWFTGSTTVTLDEGVYALRAWEGSASTPPTALSVEPALDEATAAAAEQLIVDAASAYESGGFAAAQAVIESDGLVTDLAVSDGTLVWTYAGRISSSFQEESTTKGGGSAPSMGHHSAGSTWSSRGVAGLMPRAFAEPRDLDRDIVVLSPFASAFGASDEGPELKALFEGQQCAGAVDYQADTASTLQDVKKQLTAPLQHTSTHGLVVSSNRVAIMTGVGRDSNDAEQLNMLAAGMGHVGIVQGVMVFPAFGYTTDFVRAYGLERPMPDSAVFLSACNSTRGQMPQAYLSRGASVHVGFTDIVQSGFAHDAAVAFWTEVVSGKTLNQAIGTADPGVPDDTVTPAVLQGEWNIDQLEARLGYSISDPHFDQDGWTVIKDDAAFAELGIPGQGMDATASAAWGYFESPAATWVRFEQEYCIPATATGTIRWQAYLNPYLDWSVDHDNFLMVRVDESIQAEPVWAARWSDFRTLSGATGLDSGWTHWQTSDEFLLPAPPEGETGTITLLAYGYDADAMGFAFDDFEISIQD